MIIGLAKVILFFFYNKLFRIFFLLFFHNIFKTLLIKQLKTCY